MVTTSGHRSWFNIFINLKINSGALQKYFVFVDEKMETIWKKNSHFVDEKRKTKGKKFIFFDFIIYIFSSDIIIFIQTFCTTTIWKQLHELLKNGIQVNLTVENTECYTLMKV